MTRPDTSSLSGYVRASTHRSTSTSREWGRSTRQTVVLCGSLVLVSTRAVFGVIFFPCVVPASGLDIHSSILFPTDDVSNESW